MKKGICLSAIFLDIIRNKELLLKAIDKVSDETDFNCIEFYFEGNKEDYSEIGLYLKKKGISCVFLAGYPLKEKKYDLSSEDEQKRREAVAFSKELYEYAILLKAEKFLILSGPKWKVENENKLAIQMTQSLTELLLLWKKSRPEITLEFFNDSGEPFLAVGNLLVTRKIFEKSGRDGIGITFDTSHAVQLNEDVWNAYVLLEKWIHHLHLANSVSRFPDSLLFGDKHPLFGVENGDFTIRDIRQFISRLKRQENLKEPDICSVEVISRSDFEEEWYWQQIINQTDEIWNDKGRTEI